MDKIHIATILILGFCGISMAQTVNTTIQCYSGALSVKTPVTCNSTMCKKTDSKLTPAVYSCPSPSDSLVAGCTKNSIVGVSLTTCFCNTALCNGAEDVKMTSFAVLVTFAAVLKHMLA